MTDPTGAPPERQPGTKGGGLNAKMWGLPAWGWIAIAAAGGIAAVVWLQSRRKSSDTSSSSTVPSSYDTSSDIEDTQQAILAQLRDLQGTTSTPAGTPSTGASLAAPANLKLSVGASQSTATWSPVPGATKYNIQWYFPNSNKWNGPTPFLISTAKTGDLKKGDSVTVHVAAIGADGSLGQDATATGTYGSVSTQPVVAPTVNAR